MDDADSDADTHKRLNIVWVNYFRHGHISLKGYGHAFCCLSEAEGGGADVILVYIHSADGKKEARGFFKKYPERIRIVWN